MIDYRTVRVVAARSDARIAAFVVQTGQFRRTVGVQQTFWTTVGRRTQHAQNAGAYRATIDDVALGVRSARRRIARIVGYWRRMRFCKEY